MRREVEFSLPLPKLARYLSFLLKAGARPRRAITSLIELADGESLVVGLGQSLVRVLGRDISGLRVFPTQFGSGLILPSSSAALWCWLRGDNHGKLWHTGRRITAAVVSAFDLDSVIDGFMHDTGRDLTGYLDGTENPKGPFGFARSGNLVARKSGLRSSLLPMKTER